MRVFVGLLMVASLYAEPFSVAKVTRAEGSVIKGKSGVQTGPNSKAELDWLDGTVARVGANARFSYVVGTRETTLDNGTLLMSSPKDAGGVTVRAGGTTTSTEGAGDFEVATFSGDVKVICLNGKPTVSLAINPKARKGLKPGQMLDVPKGVLKLPKADVVDLKVLLSTSTLLKMGTLKSEAALRKNAGMQGAKLPISLPGGASNEIAAARTTQLAEAQQVAARQLQQQQQIASEQAAAQQLASQQFAEQQRAATAASNVEQQAAASSISPASTPSSQGNQGKKPEAPPGQQNKPQNVPPGQAKKQ